VIVCLVTVIDCETSPTRGVRRNAVRALGRCLSGKRGKKKTYTSPSQLRDVRIRAVRTSN